MKRSTFACLALASVAVLVLTSPAPAQQQVPFKGSLEGAASITPVVPPFIVDVLVTATRNGTHLGRFTLSIPHRVDRSKLTAEGIYHFKVANGDLLWAKFSGKSLATATPGVLSIVETATITGGTGRFAGATGGFVSQRLFNAVTGRTVGSFNGSISRP